MRVNPVLRFVDAVNRGDVDGVAEAFHPDFVMIVPQHPRRGFRGRDQEVKNMRFLMEKHPEGRMEVHRMIESGDEVWVASNFVADGLHMEALVIFEIDRETDTIAVGHYYSEEVDEQSPEIDDWIEGLGTNG
jgi:ketosteroid isomerase-like protein